MSEKNPTPSWMLWKRYGWLPVLLLGIEFFVTFTFFMFVPFISIYVTNHLGYSIAFAGAVLALRLVSQQGLMIFGGYFGDKFGHRNMMIAGFVCRGIGFAGIGMVTSPALLLLTAAIGGLGGTFFSPSLKAALVAGQPKTVHKELFSYSNISGNAGMIIGPLFGTLFAVHQFPVLSLISGGLFVLIGCLIVALPVPRIEHGANFSFKTGMSSIFKNHAFLLIVVAMIPFHFIYQQLFLTYPVVAYELTGSGGWIFTLVTVLVVSFQMVATRLTRESSVERSLQIGYLFMAVTLLPLVFSESTAALTVSLIGMAAGVMLMQPAFYSFTVQAASIDTFGIFIGFSNLAMAIGGAFGNMAGGSLYGYFSAQQQTSLYWLLFAGIAFVPFCLLTIRLIRLQHKEAV